MDPSVRRGGGTGGTARIAPSGGMRAAAACSPTPLLAAFGVVALSRVNPG